jgi:hypothetical protein
VPLRVALFVAWLATLGEILTMDNLWLHLISGMTIPLENRNSFY